MNQNYCTPDELRDGLLSIHNIKINSLDDLTEMIKILAQDYQIRYKKFSTGKSRISQKYLCGLSNSISNCKSFVCYSVEDNFVRFKDANWVHSHDVRYFMKDPKYSLTQSQIRSIQEYTRMGLAAGQIRNIEDLSISSNVLYEIRRPIIKENRECEIKNFIDLIRGFHDYDVQIVTSQEKRLLSAYCFNLKIIQCKYSQDICIIDDTSCTNYFGLPLLITFVMDPNGMTQIMGFGIIESKEQSSFSSYFKALKKINGNIRLWVCDRNLSQTASIKEIFPESKIIHCHLHIKRNLVSNFGTGHEIVNAYKALIEGNYLEQDFLELLELYKYRLSTNNKKGKRVIKELIKSSESWLPSIIREYFHCGNTTTNRAEGFFGNLKKGYFQGAIKNLEYTFKAVHNMSEQMLRKSLTITNPIMPIELINENDARLIGRMACGILLLEYSKFLDIWRTKDSISLEVCNQCDAYCFHQLPCYHMLLHFYHNGKSPMIESNDIGARWIISEESRIFLNQSCISRNINKETEISNEWEYSECISKFEYYFSLAKRYNSIQDALKLALEQLEKLKTDIPVQGEVLAPLSIQLSGKKDVCPRKNCDFGVRTGHKKYRCSYCHNFGHTRPKCPFSSQIKDNEQDDKN